MRHLRHLRRCSSSRASARPSRLALASELAGFRGSHDGGTGAASTPIYQTSTFDVSEQSSFDYTRSGNPTRDALQDLCRRIEHASASFTFTSGMAALAAVVRLLRPGETVIASKDIYGGMHRLLRSTQGVEVEFIATWDLAAVEETLLSTRRCAMVCIESPSNPMMKVSDIRAIAALCQQHGALLCIDNSVMSPALSTPLDLGADIVVHSATKYLNGHADVMAGIVAVNDEDLAARIAFVQNAEGSGLAPFDAWLVLRGLKTLALRMSVAQANAIELAEVLRAHPLVSRVHYLSPGDVAERADAALHFSQARGGGALLSFETGDVGEVSVIYRYILRESCSQFDSLPLTSLTNADDTDVEISRAFVRAATAKRGGLFKQTVSFGSTASLVEMPAEMSHASIPEAERTASGLPNDLVRASARCAPSGHPSPKLASSAPRPDPPGTPRYSLPRLPVRPPPPPDARPPVQVRVSVGIEDIGDLVRSLSTALSAAQGDARAGAAGESGIAHHTNRVAAELGAGRGSGALPFGVSLPLVDVHAVGVSMPTWADIEAYEDGR
jgi:cystathionine beta-lyase